MEMFWMPAMLSVLLCVVMCRAGRLEGVLPSKTLAPGGKHNVEVKRPPGGTSRGGSSTEHRNRHTAFHHLTLKDFGGILDPGQQTSQQTSQPQPCWRNPDDIQRMLPGRFLSEETLKNMMPASKRWISSHQDKVQTSQRRVVPTLQTAPETTGRAMERQAASNAFVIKPDIRQRAGSVCNSCFTEMGYDVLETVVDFQGQNHTVINFKNAYQFIPSGRCLNEGSRCGMHGWRCREVTRAHWTLVWTSGHGVNLVAHEVPSHCQCLNLGEAVHASDGARFKAHAMDIKGSDSGGEKMETTRNMTVNSKSKPHDTEGLDSVGHKTETTWNVTISSESNRHAFDIEGSDSGGHKTETMRNMTVNSESKPHVIEGLDSDGHKTDTMRNMTVNSESNLHALDIQGSDSGGQLTETIRNMRKNMTINSKSKLHAMDIEGSDSDGHKTQPMRNMTVNSESNLHALDIQGSDSGGQKIETTRNTTVNSESNLHALDIKGSDLGGRRTNTMMNMTVSSESKLHDIEGSDRVGSKMATTRTMTTTDSLHLDDPSSDRHFTKMDQPSSPDAALPLGSDSQPVNAELPSGVKVAPPGVVSNPSSVPLPHSSMVGNLSLIFLLATASSSGSSFSPPSLFTGMTSGSVGSQNGGVVDKKSRITDT